MKLQIGPGKAYFPGWKNVDIFSNTMSDVCAGALALPFDRESFDLIYASHVLEHINRHLVSSALTHWRDLLKTGGTLRLSVPNFASIHEHYNKYKDLKSLQGLLYGGQKFYLDNHHIVFDDKYLRELLTSIGFTDIKEWDWRKTDHNNFDDYSQAYLPHMDKEKGIHMSLNLEATK